MKILKAETTALRAFLQFNSWSEARNHGLPDHDGKAVNSLLGFARQIPACRYVSANGKIGKNQWICSWGPISEPAVEMGINLISSCHVETVALMVRE